VATTISGSGDYHQWKWRLRHVEIADLIPAIFCSSWLPGAASSRKR
jgi:hypothetical protein